MNPYASVKVVATAALLAAACFSSSAMASGAETMSAAPSSAAQRYNAGKAVFADKYACSDCPLAGKSLNADVAKEVLAGRPKVALNADESEALAAYLKRRFKI